MSNPYLIEPPFSISFSGGRTSAYMLYHILDAYNGKLPDDSCVIFANTGKERTETLDFVHDIETRWPVKIDWVEYTETGDRAQTRYKVVDYQTASRNGEPFDALIRRKNYLPNPVTRICTSNLKVEPIHHRSVWHLGLSFNQVIGIRYDEPRRWGIETSKDKWGQVDNVIPMKYAKATEADVMEFWSKQPFDLQLQQGEGNCDLCYLKGAKKLIPIIQQHPHLADWWIAKEKETLSSKPSGACFRRDRPYDLLKIKALSGCPIPTGPTDDLGECRCHD